MPRKVSYFLCIFGAVFSAVFLLEQSGWVTSILWRALSMGVIAGVVTFLFNRVWPRDETE